MKLLFIFLLLITIKHSADFKAGEVISADILNERFSVLEDSLKVLEASDLVGHYNCTHWINTKLANWPIKGIYKVSSGLMGFRNDVLKIYDLGNDNYEYETLLWGSFEHFVKDTDTSLNIVHGRKKFTAYNNLAVFEIGDHPYRIGVSYLVHKKSDYISFSISIPNSGFSQSVKCVTTKSLASEPTDLSAKLEETKVTLSWKDNSNDENGFDVLRKDSLEGEFKTIFNTASDAITYLDTLTQNGSYWYRVKAFNGNGTSIGTNVIRLNLTSLDSSQSTSSTNPTSNTSSF